MIKLADHGVRLHLQFFYSHCGFKMNEMADQYAKYLTATLTLEDNTPRWLTDATTMIRRKIKERRKMSLKINVNTERTRNFGWDPSELQPELHRKDSVRFHRHHADSSMECGVLRRRVGLDCNMACTWCCPYLHPDMLRGKEEGEEERTEELPEVYRDNSDLMREHVQSRDVISCAYCEKVYVRTQTYITHHHRKHIDRPLPLWMYMPEIRSQKRPFVELLKRHKDPRGRAMIPPDQRVTEKASSQSIHPICPHEGCGLVNAPYRHVARCPHRSQTVKEAQQLTKSTKEVDVSLQTPEGGVTETFRHVYLECPRLSLLRTDYPDLFPPFPNDTEAIAMNHVRDGNIRVLQFMDEALILNA
eukprot:Tbor_TRINITY_DN5543_c2_g2::TRINITY_DN5543_c2_g2_i4::g.12662::m.12662